MHSSSLPPDQSSGAPATATPITDSESATAPTTMPSTTDATAAVGVAAGVNARKDDATSIATTAPTTNTEPHAAIPHNHAPPAATESPSTTQHAAQFPPTADSSSLAPSRPPGASLPSSEIQSQHQDNRPATPHNQTDVTMTDAPQIGSSQIDPVSLPPPPRPTQESSSAAQTETANPSHMEIGHGEKHPKTEATTAIAQQSVPNNAPQTDATVPWTPNPTANLPPSTPTTNAYKEHRNSYSETFNHHAALMMALATMHTDRNMMSHPQLEQTVTPSQVTLPPPLEVGPLQERNGMSVQDRLNNSDRHLESFARIEFADSVFQMTTYEVVIGRDQRALNQARRDEKRANEYKQKVENNARLGLSPPPPITHDRSKFSKSYVSEEGGMLGPESESDGDLRPAKRRKTSTGGGSSHDNEESQENIISNRQYVSHTPGAAAVDLASLRPSPHHVPFIGIHSPGPDIASKTKAISREHLKISYNQKEGVFEAIPLHKNGFFCEEVHHRSEKVILKCGDRLQIKDVDFRFIINGVERGRTGAEEFADEKPAAKKHSQGGKEMSFDFEQSQDNERMQDTSDELSDVEVSPPELSDGDEAEEEEETGEAEVGEETAELEDVAPEATPTTSQPLPTTETDLLLPQIPKKRGPGRPPKNGIMSKREQRLLKKQQQELAKKTIPQVPAIEPPIKRKVGRPRKHPLPDDAGDRPEKRKYKPRKPKNEDGLEGSDVERPLKEKKEKKVRPKSPPLELKIEDYTAEDLQKPNKNYGVLIDETLSAAPDGLTLKQIYKRICQRYPWFYFHTETKGWESSVRHNLIGNDAFRKDDTTNVWLRVPGVELDAGKKRKATSPDRNLAAQNYGAYSYPYNAAHHMVPGAPGYNPGQAAQGFQVANYNAQQQHQLQQQQQPGQAPRPAQQQFGSGPLAAGQSAQPTASQPPAPAQVPGYGPQATAPARPQPGATQQPGAYSSPYASRPPPPANPPIKTEDGSSTTTMSTAQQTPVPKVNPVQAQRVSTTPGVSPAVPQQQPQQQQQPVPQASRPAATSPPAAPPKPIIDPRLLNAVVNLKNGLIENLKRARNPHAETVVYSAINRCAGLKTEGGENDNVERICIKGIRQVVDGFLSKHRSPTPGGSSTQGTTEASGMLDPHALKTLLGFKNVSCSTLQASLGAAQAEAVTLSAIDRVLGLADVSLVRDNERLTSLETSLMQTTRQLLTTLEKSRVQGLTSSK
ncbi:unnamed protein product [Clonostachys byssicola]|uniref:Forkhead domain-containing protein n=1 Tax=Clonostachys byssicola TaxID=160290 RepID=A0A9N9UZF8_9HYPO|nr:unnamed protein product [Clonostachys byssicola]